MDGLENLKEEDQQSCLQLTGEVLLAAIRNADDKQINHHYHTLCQMKGNGCF